MKSRLILIVLFLLYAAFTSIAQTISIVDIFGRELNNSHIKLVDWQGHLFNPYIKFQIRSDAPIELTLEAKGSPRLMMDEPSVNHVQGATKRISINDINKEYWVKLTIAPDREGGFNEIEEYKLSFLINNKVVEEIPILVVDQDDDLKAKYPYEIDYSAEDYNSGPADFKTNPAVKKAFEAAINDWFYFFEFPNYDEVGFGQEEITLPGDDWSDEKKVTIKNKKPYKGFYLFARTISGEVYATGNPSNNGKYHTINGVVPANKMPRSGFVCLDHIPGRTQYTDISNSEWNDNYYYKDLTKWVDIYSVSEHEFSHAIVFSGFVPNMKKYNDEGGRNASKVIDYQGNPVPLNGYHMYYDEKEKEKYTDRISGQPYFFPYRRWHLTKLELLIAEAAGWQLRDDIQPFMKHTITSNSVLPKLHEGISYSYKLEATGGVPFYDWKIISGELPKGLFINRFNGEISGKHIIENGKTKYQFTIGLKDYDDQSGYFEKEFELNVEENLEGKIFRIKTAHSGGKKMCLDIASGEIGKNGSTIQMWDCHDTYENEYDDWFGNQFWKFERTSDNNYRIRSLIKTDGTFYMDAAYTNQGQNGRKAHLWEPTSRMNQIWKVSKNDDGTYRIQTADPKGNDMSLDLALDPANVGRNGGKIHLWSSHSGTNQKWELVPIK